MLDRKRLKLAKEKSQQDKEFLRRQREYEKLSLEKQTEVKKRLADFRHKLREHLLKKKEPMAGEIMRVLDDSLVFYLLEKYDGYSLSPEAILALLGNSLGTSLLNPEPLPPRSHHTSSGGLALDPAEASDLFGPDLEAGASSLMRGGLGPNQSHTASLSAQLSYSSLVNNYRSFGKRSPPRAHGDQGQGQGGLPSLSLSRSFGESQAFQHCLNTSMSAPVTGFGLRSLPHDQRHPTAHFKALAGGFRAQTGGGGGGGPQETEESHPLFTNFSSPFPGDSGKRAPLVVLSSEHFRSVSEAMGYPLPALLTASFRDQREQQAEADRQETAQTEQINQAISAMHEQLLEEGILPSLRPEKVLSAQQLQEIGLKKKTVDQVFHQLTGKDISAVLARAPTTRADEIKAKLARNNTMSAGQLSLINDLLQLERDQDRADLKAADQQQQQQQEGDRAVSPLKTDLPAPTPAQPAPAGQSQPSPLSRSATVGLLGPILESKSNDSHDDHAIRRSQSRSGDDSLPGSPSHQKQPTLRPELQKSHTAPLGPAPAPLFFGSVQAATTAEDKERLEAVARSEREKATERLVLPAARDPREKYRELLEEFPLLKEQLDLDQAREKEKLLRRTAAKPHKDHDQAEAGPEGQSHGRRSASPKGKVTRTGRPRSRPDAKYLSRDEREAIISAHDFAHLADQFPQKGPKAIKTRDSQEAVAPYGSWDEETKVMNTGVASGSGLMLWQPRDVATATGRYRAGRSAASPLRPLPRELHGRGASHEPPNPLMGYLGIHADNDYSKGKTRRVPFVSAT